MSKVSGSDIWNNTDEHRLSEWLGDQIKQAVVEYVREGFMTFRGGQVVFDVGTEDGRWRIERRFPMVETLGENIELLDVVHRDLSGLKKTRRTLVRMIAKIDAALGDKE
jgi:hypothetical protein